jgi:hypothetical protein
MARAGRAAQTIVPRAASLYQDVLRLVPATVLDTPGADGFVVRAFTAETTRWSTTPSFKVKLPHPINVGVLFGANLVTFSCEFWGNETFEFHRVAGRAARTFVPRTTSVYQDILRFVPATVLDTPGADGFVSRAFTALP